MGTCTDLCQLSWSSFEFSFHYHCPYTGLPLGNTLPRGYFTTLDGRRVVRFWIKVKVLGIEDKG